MITLSKDIYISAGRFAMLILNSIFKSEKLTEYF